jgi:hypothetical protein
MLLQSASIVKQLAQCLTPPTNAGFSSTSLMQGFRAIRPMTLMTIGEYREPEGSYFPSVLY